MPSLPSPDGVELEGGGEGLGGGEGGVGGGAEEEVALRPPARLPDQNCEHAPPLRVLADRNGPSGQTGDKRNLHPVAERFYREVDAPAAEPLLARQPHALCQAVSWARKGGGGLGCDRW